MGELGLVYVGFHGVFDCFVHGYWVYTRSLFVILDSDISEFAAQSTGSTTALRTTCIKFYVATAFARLQSINPVYLKHASGVMCSLYPYERQADHNYMYFQSVSYTKPISNHIQ